MRFVQMLTSVYSSRIWLVLFGPDVFGAFRLVAEESLCLSRQSNRASSDAETCNFHRPYATAFAQQQSQGSLSLETAGIFGAGVGNELPNFEKQRGLHYASRPEG